MNLFAYGTLVFADIWELVVERAVQSQQASLRGFEVKRAEGDVYPVMFQSENRSELRHVRTVPGLVYYDLTEAEFVRLDAYEAGLYERRTVQPILRRGTVVTCESYVLPKRHWGRASEEPWTPEWFAEHAKQQYLQRLLP